MITIYINITNHTNPNADGGAELLDDSMHYRENFHAIKV